MAVRSATRDDVRGLARTFARSFYDDPVYEWFFPDARRRLAQNRRFFGVRCRQLIAQDVSWVSDGLEAAALWTLPDRWHTSTREDWEIIAPILPATITRFGPLFDGFKQMDVHHPETPPHLYLAILGTDPAQQGRGLGGAVMASGLDLCDREGLPAYLESSKERNVSYYARFGFRLTEAFALGTGPTVYGMWRDPR